MRNKAVLAGASAAIRRLRPSALPARADRSTHDGFCYHRTASDSSTVPHDLAGLPVRTLRVEVVGGPDATRLQPAQGDTLTVGTARGNDLVLSDRTVSRYHLELERREDGIRAIDQGSTNGTLVGAVRIERALVPAGVTIQLGSSTIRVTDGETVSVDAAEVDAVGEIRGRSPAMRRLMARVLRATASSAPALIVGESGTGKELIARATRTGPSREGPVRGGGLRRGRAHARRQ